MINRSKQGGWINAAIMAGGALLGGLMGNSAQSKANKTNVQLQKDQLDWQERMSNTEWQRGAEDLKNAGLNPMLAFSQGGASTPNVSAATVEPVDALAKSVSSAGDKAVQTLAMQQMQANIDLTKANTLKAIEDAKTAGVTSSNAAERQAREIEQIRKATQQVAEQVSLTYAQRVQVEKMMPLLMEAADLNMKFTEQQTHSAATKERLDKAQLPGAEAEARVWEQLGAAAKGANIGANALQQIIAIIRSIRR